MDQTSVPFGDDVGLEVLAALRELGEGLTKLSDIESISKSGERKCCALMLCYVVIKCVKYVKYIGNLFCNMLWWLLLLCHSCEQLETI